MPVARDHGISITSRKAIFIVGYYRTGTSALSGALAQYGVRFANETDMNEHNPKGFFESSALIRLDSDILNVLGSYWSDIRMLPEGWNDRADVAVFRERLTDIIRDRFVAKSENAALPWAVKHPHLCRLLPLYASVAEKLGYDVSVIHTNRDPFTVASSQAKKNGLTRSHALLLWASYVVEGEKVARPYPRVWVDYTSLVSDQNHVVSDVLANLGISGTIEKPNSEFVTKTLVRSKPADKSDLHPLVVDLVDRVLSAISHRAPSEVWDNLSVDISRLAKFLGEVGKSPERAVPGCGGGGVMYGMAAPLAVRDGVKPEGHPLRSPERTDEAAKARLLARLAHAGVASGDLCNLTVIVVVQVGRQDALQATWKSIVGSWVKPSHVILISDGVEPPDLPAEIVRDQVVGEDAETIRLAVVKTLDGVTTDYVAILNAGDTIEPDAIGRFQLAILKSASPPNIVYCDQIIGLAENPWIRSKPVWSATRLRQSCFVGEWVWYRSAVIKTLGGWRGDLAGAEEYDYQLRYASSDPDGSHVTRIPEPLLCWDPTSMRDTVGIDVAVENAVRALNEHLARPDLVAKAKAGQYPGTFKIDYFLAQDAGTVAFVFDCRKADQIPLHVSISTLLPTIRPGDAIILLHAAGEQPPATDKYLAAIVADESGHFSFFHIIEISADVHVSAAIAGLFPVVAEQTYLAFLDAKSAPDDHSWHWIQRGALDFDTTIAAAGCRHYVNSKDRNALIGPVLFGSLTRVGAGRDAMNPGPGGWLVADQDVDAVEPPGLMMRVSALRSTWHIGDAPTTWSGLCERIVAEGRVVWMPSLGFSVPMPSATVSDPEMVFAGTKPWNPAHHHPALSVVGDTLQPERRFGLVGEEPADRTFTLVSAADPTTSAEVLASARTARRTGSIAASWAQEPIDRYSLARLKGRRWIRINPCVAPEDPESKPCGIVWTRPPALSDGVSLKDVAPSSVPSWATSPSLVRKLIGQGLSKTKLWRPGIDVELWRSVGSVESEQGGKLRVIMVDEGFTADWAHDIISKTHETISWIVVSASQVAYPGSVSHVRSIYQEIDFASLFKTVRPSVLFRPVTNAPWLSGWLPTMAAAAGCVVMQDESLDAPDHAIIRPMSKRPDEWTKLLMEWAGDPASLVGSGEEVSAAADAILAAHAETAIPPWLA